ncbi:hypothetical protein B0T17DRAFT_621711 [Bombardia bombarda]|uniref:Uncharacterized protein n=1 Tax=Bombardia bombarda TaxID=252184 RepID=A0AA39TZV1_9PEZI|nr:hypothetical protein B0T17DRAFT_621711 [Bombardia bombarda]
MHDAAYDPQAFDTLPSIGNAAARFRDSDGETLVSSTFRDLFTRYEMDRVFGLILLHRHFPLHEDERLVEYNGTSVPWRLDKLAAHIRPTSWLLTADGAIRPYEFHHSLVEDGPKLDLDDSLQRAFLEKFKQVLSEKGIDGLFGLCRYPGDDFKGRVEITQGRSNINLKFEDYPTDLDASMSNAAWFFSPPLVNFKCICPCSYANNSHTGNHNGHYEAT